MGKQFLGWLAAGLGGILTAAVAHFSSGAAFSLKDAGTFIGFALLVRAANWVVATLGPKYAV